MRRKVPLTLRCWDETSHRFGMETLVIYAGACRMLRRSFSVPTLEVVSVGPVDIRLPEVSVPISANRPQGPSGHHHRLDGGAL